MGLNIESQTPAGMAVQAGMGIVTDVIGQEIQKRRNDRAFRQQKELMEIQQQNQMKLNQQGKDLAYQQWKDTNYNAQRRELEKAGLNAGLLYGMSGGGGTTANAGSGGSAASGQAPAQPPMDINAINNMATLAQIELTKALTKKADAEAEKTAGADTDNVKANTALTNMNEANAKISNEIQTRSIDNVLDTIKANRDKAVAESSTASTEANVNATTQNEQIEKIKNEAIQSAIEIGIKKMNIKLTEEQIINMREQVKIGKYNAEKVTTDQVAGKQLNTLIEKIYNLFGVKNEQISK